MPMLAGIPVPAEIVRELAERADEPAASTLRDGLDAERAVIALTILEREQLLWALDEAPTDGLAERRGMLLREHEWRKRVGLA